MLRSRGGLSREGAGTPGSCILLAWRSVTSNISPSPCLLWKCHARVWPTILSRISNLEILSFVIRKVVLLSKTGLFLYYGEWAYYNAQVLPFLCGCEEALRYNFSQHFIFMKNFKNFGQVSLFIAFYCFIFPFNSYFFLYSFILNYFSSYQILYISVTHPMPFWSEVGYIFITIKYSHLITMFLAVIGFIIRFSWEKNK